MYTLVTMGYHVGGLISHFMHPKGNDFLEMALHHFCAFYLFFGYYMANSWEIGMVIAFLHDIADITANITKCGSNTKWTKVTVFFFLINIAVWFHTRLFVLPYQLIYGTIYKACPWWTSTSGENGVRIVSGFIYLLSCMTMLHFYWFYIFFNMLKHYAKKGEAEDLQNKVKAKEDKAVTKNEKMTKGLKQE